MSPERPAGTSSEGANPPPRPAPGGGANLLAGEPSAYLRQHADNPVHWQPFSDAAFAQASARDVPIFLSIGYAACHWCHVMASESFEDPGVAAYLNSNFVAIKVDREERPDVDAVYMAATQAISGAGGWPMSVFLAPDGRAFHAGTYFPPTPLPGRPSFRQVLQAVVEAWTERRAAVEDSAGELTAILAGSALAPVATKSVPGSWLYGGALDTLLADAAHALAAAEDPEHGGFGGAPKFPPTPALEFLLRHAAGPTDSAADSVDVARGVAARTLSAMANSALYDQLAGGFARYSVTADWSLPHFEKMLYDNAGLLRVYAHWLRLPGGGAVLHGDAFPAAEARRAAAGTARWMLAELRLPGGAFASSLDADTVVAGVHQEGGTYLWTASELEEAARAAGLPGEGLWAARLMGVGAEPAPLHPARPLDAGSRGRWEALAPALAAARNLRAQPARDDKVVAGWNGMAVAALADAAQVLEDPRLLAAAVAAAAYLWEVHWDGAVLSRVSHEGAARGIAGLLEDYAACAEGFLALYAATGDGEWFLRAGTLLDAAVDRFASGGLLREVPDAPGPLHNAAGGPLAADPFDNATASGSAVFAAALLAHAGYSGSARHRSMAEGILDTLPALARRAPRVAGGALAVAAALQAGPLEVAVVGPDTDATRDLVRTAARSASPGMVLAVRFTDGAPDGAPGVAANPGTDVVPLLRDRPPASDGGPLAYVCRGMVCALPVGTPQELAARLAQP
ncbi:thioredoxin domain-containing protein [Arthrobacter sp. 35W]|uniref:thioredoxin domain-containing protein n=1 Tax=Arthrobacter sp. 35W TaxID=1132441 RepID=UPI00041D03CF|nr:thioredoxin domain-containing protein [Arthrobacter sp. 35W]